MLISVGRSALCSLQILLFKPKTNYNNKRAKTKKSSRRFAVIVYQILGLRRFSWAGLLNRQNVWLRRNCISLRWMRFLQLVPTFPLTRQLLGAIFSITLQASSRLGCLNANWFSSCQTTQFLRYGHDSAWNVFFCASLEMSLWTGLQVCTAIPCTVNMIFFSVTIRRWTGELSYKGVDKFIHSVIAFHRSAS